MRTFLCRKLYRSIFPIALRKARIIYNFGLSQCNRVKNQLLQLGRPAQPGPYIAAIAGD